jgi:Ca2+-binding EF-hand superfamily protein
MKEKIMKTKMLMTLLVASATALAAHAQNDDSYGPPPGGPGFGPRGHHRPPPLPIVTALDVNHDGVIDASEIANASAALKTLDKNGDGQLTADEYLPTRPADAPKDAPTPPTPPILKALDANGDGVISADEIANAPAALKTLDKNGDGQLTRDEFCPPPPMRGNFGDQNQSDERPPGPPPQE